MPVDPFTTPDGQALPLDLRDRAYEWANRNAAAAAQFQHLNPRRDSKRWSKIRAQFVKQLRQRLNQSPNDILNYLRGYDQDAPHDPASLALPRPRMAPLVPGRPPGTYGGFPKSRPPV